MKNLACFKAYDVRGRVPQELDEALAYRIGRAYAAFLSPSRVAVGRDVRLSSPRLAGALMAGLNDSGVEVRDLGLCGTEQVYFYTSHLQLDGGIMITASHNPPDYNGMKFVREGSRPLSGDSGLNEIEALAAAGKFPPEAKARGQCLATDSLEAYVEHLLSYVDLSALKPLKVVANAGNGCAGPVLDRLERSLPFQFLKLFPEPDGTFPHGVPNPLLPENREATARAVRESGADLGLAWDGDFDRCFFFDEQGTFIEGYYLVGLLAQALLSPASRRRHHPRPPAHLEHRGNGAGGRWHAHHEQNRPRLYQGADAPGERGLRRRNVGAPLLPGFCLLRQRHDSLAAGAGDHVPGRRAPLPTGGAENEALSRQRRNQPQTGGPRRGPRPGGGFLRSQAVALDRTDGLSLEFKDWRFNLRKSNTEPVLRLNVETRQNPALLQEKTAEILGMLD